MTKVSVFGQEASEPKKPIEFVKQLCTDGKLNIFPVKPKDVDNIQLLFDKGSGEYDVMIAWDDGAEPFVVLGHWNDGVV